MQPPSASYARVLTPRRLEVGRGLSDPPPPPPREEEGWPLPICRPSCVSGSLLDAFHIILTLS